MPISGEGEHCLPGRPPNYAIDHKMIVRGTEIHLCGPVPEEKLAACRLAEGLCCFRPTCKQLEALVKLAGEPDGLIFTASMNNTILAYVTFQKPDYPWWQSRCLPCLLELGTLEVDQKWRRKGLASALMEALFHNNSFTFFERCILIAVLSPYNWDLCGTGLEPWAYRKMMAGFFKKYDFHPRKTADPEIEESPASMLLVRTGKLVDEASQSCFVRSCLLPGE